MRRRVFQPHGLSLVETTIILLVLMVLTGVLAPSINDFVNDAKDVKVKEDCEAIGATVMRLARDVGPCLRNITADPCIKINRVDVLYSDGDSISFADDIDSSTAPDFSHPDIDGAGFLNWDMGPVSGDTMESQFLQNLPTYGTPGTVGNHNPLAGFRVPGPAFFLGWRGAYLEPHVGPDPHGNPYVVNSVFLSVATDATAGSGEGQRSGGWDRDVICVSAGRNRRFETPFGGNSTKGTARTGDDFVYVISGDTR
ncbi:MAG: hypothetical protein HYS05_20225 [Acidobacteria bacterium]|nr:hypothetical protein [Acidobacteriota bacterium]